MSSKLAKIESLYMPNLLINGDFQVWQRGESFSITKTGYTADRWGVYKPDSETKTFSVAKSNGRLCVSPAATATQCGIFQYIELCESMINLLKGQKLTLSFEVISSAVQNLTASVTLLKTTGASDAIGIKTTNYASVANEYKKVEMTFTIPADIDFTNAKTLQVVLFSNSITKPLYFKYAKFEFNYATPYIPRSYAEELALCQRYCYVLDSKSYYENYGTFVMYNNKAQLYCAFDTEKMYTRPTASWRNFSGITLYAIKDFANIEISERAGISYVSGCMLLDMINTYVNGLSGAWQLRPNTQIIIDAEIY